MKKNVLCLLLLVLPIITSPVLANPVAGTIPVVTYANKSACFEGAVRDIYISDSISSSSCNAGGGGTSFIRCSCVYDRDTSSYKWELTSTVIGAGGSGGGSNDAVDISITDAGNYYTSDNVEGALQEIGSGGFGGSDTLLGLTDVNDTLTANTFTFWNGTSLQSYPSVQTNGTTFNFTVSPTVSSVAMCLSDGTNCIPASNDNLSDNSIVDLSDVGPLTANKFLLVNNSLQVTPSSIFEIGASQESLNFTISPTIQTKNVCLADGTNCINANNDDITDDTLSELSDVSNAIPSDGNFLKYSASTWAPSTLSVSDIPSLPLTKLDPLVSGEGYTKFNSSGVLVSVECSPDQILITNALGALECAGISTGVSVDVSNDLELVPGPLTNIVVTNHDGEGIFSYDAGTDTLTIDASNIQTPIVGYTIENRATPPAGGAMVYYDTDIEELCQFKASNWVTISGNIACNIAQFNLLIEIDEGGTGSGTVTTNVGSINCPGTCTFDYDEDTVVTITATPASGSEPAIIGGNPDCSDGSVTMIENIICTYVFNLTPSGSNATSWISSTLAYWNLEESGAGNAISQGTCGSTCTATEFGGTIARVSSSPSPRQGTYSAFIDSSSTNNRRFGCTNTTCTQLRYFGSVATGDLGDFTVGINIYPLPSAQPSIRVMENFDGSTGPLAGGFRIFITDDGTVNAQLWQTPSVTATLTANAACPDNTWCNIVLTFTTNLATLYVNGTSRDTETSIATVGEPDSGKIFRLCGTSDNATKFNGYCDEAFVYLNDMTSQQVCRACRSGIDGSGGVCNLGDPTQYTSQANTCGSCTPSACNATLP